MPRTGRVLVPNCPHHVVQRGHNQQDVFITPDDFRYYLKTLREWKRELDVKVYAFCLMTNHVHLVVEPPDDVSRLSALMKRLAGRQTRFFNRRAARSGTLWGGRFKSSPIQTSRYFLHCCRYVELNPVRAQIVRRPAEYEWSSYKTRVGLRDDFELDPHPSFGVAAGELQDASWYRGLVEDTGADEPTALIRTALRRGQLTGDSAFVDEVERLLGRRILPRGPGRRAK